jgi:hypothetical protein
MSSKKFKKTRETQPQPEVKARSKTPAKVWIARGLIIVLCIAVVVTLIPSVFF